LPFSIARRFLLKLSEIEDWPHRAPIPRRQQNVRKCVIETDEHLETSRGTRRGISVFNECALKVNAATDHLDKRA